MNLQICFVNDSGSDKDSDADDSKTETSLDTPLSPMVRPQSQRNESHDTQGGAAKSSLVKARVRKSEIERDEYISHVFLNSPERTHGKITISLHRYNMRHLSFAFPQSS